MSPLVTSLRRACLATTLALAACGGGGDGTPAAASSGFYATKTGYQPRQLLASYEAPPTGFRTVYAELVARHGSRGLSSLKYDDAVLVESLCG